MALFRCGGGPSTPNETILWTNSDPTAAQSTAITANLSESINNFDSVKITYCQDTTHTNVQRSVIYPVTDITNVIMCTAENVGIDQVRRYKVTSDTTVTISNITRFGEGGSTTPTALIPISIAGLK